MEEIDSILKVSSPSYSVVKRWVFVYKVVLEDRRLKFEETETVSSENLALYKRNLAEFLGRFITIDRQGSIRQKNKKQWTAV